MACRPGGPGYHWPGPGWPWLAPPLPPVGWPGGTRASQPQGLRGPRVPPWGSTRGGEGWGGWREGGREVGGWWVPHSPPWLTSDPWPRGRELNPGVWCRPYGAPGPMVHQALWCTRPYGAPGLMVHQALWCTRPYGAPGPMVHQA